MIRNRKYRKQRGMFGGAIEQQMILAGAAIIVVGAVGTAYVLLGNSKAKTEWNMLDSLVTNIRDLYSGEAYPASDLSVPLIGNKRIGNMKTSGGNTLINQYGGTVAPVGATTNFTVTDPAVPQPDCIAILKSIPASGYTSISVNGGAAVTTFPIIEATARTNCSVTTAAGNSIALTTQ
jgi:PilS N terminal